MNLPKRRWGDMAWTDFQSGDTAKWIAVVPLAATEQHGPHLPLSTDTEIMHGYLERVIGLLPDDVPATFLPVQTICLSPEHRDFPGTLTVSPEIALRTWVEIGRNVARAGIRKIVFVSSHGGNNGLMEIAARELRADFDMLAVTTSFARFGYPDNLFSSQEIVHGVHGGDIETSLMLAFRTDLVRQDKLADFPSEAAQMEKDFVRLRTGRPAGFSWMAQDLSAHGVLGNAANASAAKGEAAARHGAKAFVELLGDVRDFSLDRLAKGPRG